MATVSNECRLNFKIQQYDINKFSPICLCYVNVQLELIERKNKDAVHNHILCYLFFRQSLFNDLIFVEILIVFSY